VLLKKRIQLAGASVQNWPSECADLEVLCGLYWQA
jgi:hypothetical protein